jgi:hypothetical protein
VDMDVGQLLKITLLRVKSMVLKLKMEKSWLQAELAPHTLVDSLQDNLKEMVVMDVRVFK